MIKSALILLGVWWAVVPTVTAKTFDIHCFSKEGMRSEPFKSKNFCSKQPGVRIHFKFDPEKKTLHLVTAQNSNRPGNFHKDEPLKIIRERHIKGFDYGLFAIVTNPKLLNLNVFFIGEHEFAYFEADITLMRVGKENTKAEITWGECSGLRESGYFKPTP